MKKKIIVYIVLILLSTISIFTVYYFKYIKNSNNKTNDINNSSNIGTNVNVAVENLKKSVKIFSGDDRPIAVMIDNEAGAWPHSGLNDAYLIYEILIEGGESRMMALFKGEDTSKIGPIRSSRHYFVYYALENNAIYTHIGFSPKAQEAISQYDVNNINGITQDSKIFFRVGSGYHNAYTSIKKIKGLAKEKKYLTISIKDYIFDVDPNEINIAEGEDVSKIYLKYSDLHNVSYEYDSVNKVYLRSMRGKKDIDRETKEQYFAKNIIIIQANNYPLSDGSNKGRQQVETIGEGTGYFLTNGKKKSITWKKESAEKRTYIYDSNGKEIVLNDGITYLQVVPLGDNISFSN